MKEQDFHLSETHCCSCPAYRLPSETADGASNPIRAPRLTLHHIGSLPMAALPLVAIILFSPVSTQPLSSPPLLQVLQRLSSLSDPSPYTASPGPSSTGPNMGLKTRSQDPPPLYTVLNAKNNFYVFKRLKKLRSTVCCGMRLLRRIQIPGARPVTPGHGRSHRARQFVRWRGCFCTALLVWPAKHTYLFSGSLKGLLTSASEHSLYVHQEWTSFGATGRGENSKSSGTEASPSRSNSGTGPSAAASLLCREHGQNPHFRIFHLLSSRSRILFQNTLCLLPYFFQVFLQMAPSQ